MSERGALLFARYAYPPNALGYCGPDGAEEMLGPGAAAAIARRARGFDGAWSYLESIARSGRIDDPLDERVVEAYWVGNDLLDRLEPERLITDLRTRFAGQPGGTWRQAIRRARAHHSFHVFEVYPWAGLLSAEAGSAGRNGTAARVLDRCRIRVGRVVEVRGTAAVVRCRPLRWTGASLEEEPEQDELVRWRLGGVSTLEGLAVGDHVSMHWDWVCDVLADDRIDAIRTAEARQLAHLGLRAG